MNDKPETQQSPLVERILSWLDRGYPAGVPPQDRFAVGALLRNRLSDAELANIVRRMAESHRVDEWFSHKPVTEEDIARYIRKVTDGTPTDDDVQRVSARLAAAGWPLLGLDAQDEDDRAASTRRHRSSKDTTAQDD
ncbi:MAG: DUF3349 domain-containing protein [Lawsonella sp.]